MIAKRSQTYGLTQRAAVKMIVARDTTFNWPFFFLPQKPIICWESGSLATEGWWVYRVLERNLADNERVGRRAAGANAVVQWKKEKMIFESSCHKAVQAGNDQTNQPWEFQSPFFYKQQAERQTLSAGYLGEKRFNKKKKCVHISRANANSDLAMHPFAHLEVEWNKWVVE